MATSKVIFVEQPKAPDVAPGTAVLYARDNQLHVRYEDGQTAQVGTSATSVSDAGARSYNNANLSIPSGEWTAVSQNAEDYDTHSFHSTSVNNSRMTVPSGQAGKYLIVFNAEFAQSAGGNMRGFRIYMNGTHILTSQETAASNAKVAGSVSVVIQLSEGDYVEGYVYQDSGGALNLEYQSRWSPYLMVQRMG